VLTFGTSVGGSKWNVCFMKRLNLFSNCRTSERSHIFIEAFCVFSYYLLKTDGNKECILFSCYPCTECFSDTFVYLSVFGKANLFLSNWKFKILMESMFNTSPCIRFMSNASFWGTLIKDHFESHVKNSTSLFKVFEIGVSTHHLT